MYVIKITGTDSEVHHGKMMQAVKSGLEDFDIEYDRISVSREREEESED